MASFREFLQRAGEVVIPGVIGFAAGRLTAGIGGDEPTRTQQSLIDIALRGATAALAPSTAGGAVVAARAAAPGAPMTAGLFGLSPIMLIGIVLLAILLLR